MQWAQSLPHLICNIAGLSLSFHTTESSTISLAHFWMSLETSALSTSPYLLNTHLQLHSKPHKVLGFFNVLFNAHVNRRLHATRVNLVPFCGMFWNTSTCSNPDTNAPPFTRNKNGFMRFILPLHMVPKHFEANMGFLVLHAVIAWCMSKHN